MPSAAWYGEIHQRLLARDPVAPAELAEAVLQPLVRKLRKAHRVEDELLVEAATDALVDYLKEPGKFDPEKRGLFGYLVMAATGDLRNAFDKQGRRQQREVSLDALSAVEVAEACRKKDETEKRAVARVDSRRMSQQIADLFPDPKDRQLLELILDNERKTEPYAHVLGFLDSLSVDAQRREVKRHKDRIKKRLERYGQDPRR